MPAPHLATQFEPSRRHRLLRRDRDRIPTPTNSQLIDRSVDFMVRATAAWSRTFFDLGGNVGATRALQEGRSGVRAGCGGLSNSYLCYLDAAAFLITATAAPNPFTLARVLILAFWASGRLRIMPM